MEKEVVISIKGMQNFEGALPDVIELVTEGRLARDGESYTLSYQESELTGLEGTLTTIQVDGEQVTLMRVGEFNSQLVFQEGRRHLSMYNTPYGAMTIGVNTRHLLARLTDQGAILRWTTRWRWTTPWPAATSSASTCGRPGAGWTP